MSDALKALTSPAGCLGALVIAALMLLATATGPSDAEFEQDQAEEKAFLEAAAGACRDIYGDDARTFVLPDGRLVCRDAKKQVRRVSL